MLPSHKKSEDEVLVISGIILIIKFEVNVFSKLMADVDNSYWDTQFHETQFSIELHTEIMHCAHN